MAELPAATSGSEEDNIYDEVYELPERSEGKSVRGRDRSSIPTYYVGEDGH